MRDTKRHHNASDCHICGERVTYPDGLYLWGGRIIHLGCVRRPSPALTFEVRGDVASRQEGANL